MGREGSLMRRASILWTLPPLLSNSAPREARPEKGGELQDYDGGVVKWTANTQYCAFFFFLRHPLFLSLHMKLWDSSPSVVFSICSHTLIDDAVGN